MRRYLDAEAWVADSRDALAVSVEYWEGHGFGGELATWGER